MLSLLYKTPLQNRDFITFRSYYEHILEENAIKTGGKCSPISVLGVVCIQKVTIIGHYYYFLLNNNSFT